MALRVSRIENLNESGSLVASGGLEFCVSSTSFQKSSIGWPQPKGHQILLKNWIFDGLFPKKGLVLLCLVSGMIKPSGSGNLLRKYDCRGC